MRIGPWIALGVAVLAVGPAEGAEGMDAGHLQIELSRLESTGRVLYVAAHPDDENTRLLAYLANARHFEVAYLSLTRGGGGQNLIGPEQGDLLGVIRTQELLAARREHAVTAAAGVGEFTLVGADDRRAVRREGDRVGLARAAQAAGAAFTGDG